MTSNADFKDIELGDRTLMVFLGRNFYDFYTYDVKQNLFDHRV